MALEILTPSEVMYICMKKFGGIANNDLARIVFSPTFTYGGVPIVNRLDERTFLSRVVVRATPGDFPEGAFRSLPECAQDVYSQLVKRYPKAEGKRSIISYFEEEGCDRMSNCLCSIGLNDALYRNMVSRIDQMGEVSLGDKAVLMILLFIATGALGNPSRASRITLDYARRITSDSFTTEVVTPEEAPVQRTMDTGIRLGLCRLINGKMRMPAYTLSTDEEGTEIGSLATAEGAINDVGPGVSRRHLRIFRADDGCWYAEGLDSTNGTYVLHADSDDEEPIELPKYMRSANDGSSSVRLFANDTLRLAGNTYFAVLEIV